MGRLGGNGCRGWDPSEDWGEGSARWRQGGPVTICPPLPCRVLTITAVAQLFVLGCTWVFGLFLFEPRSWVLSYIFTILNCLQGLFLYVLHCLLNKKVGR